MFNPANLANEVFGILRSFDYVVNIFDFDGNRVYEPADARRFFASPKNITVSIHEDGENSSIKMFLSKSTDISEVSGLISTMRSTASKFGLLFNVRKYERELKPKDLAPNGASDFDAGISLSSAEGKGTTPPEQDAAAAPAPAEISFEKDADDDETAKEATTLDRITGEVSTLSKNFKKVIGVLRQKKMKESAKNSAPVLNEADGQTIHLNAFDMDVEVDAWEALKQGNLQTPADINVATEDAQAYATQYESDHGTQIDAETAIRSLQIERIAAAAKATAPMFGELLRYCLARVNAGNGDKMATMVLEKAIAAAQTAPPAVEAPVVPQIAQPTAQPVSRQVGESLIMTESIKEFGRWFDSMSPTKIFEADFTGGFGGMNGDDDAYDDTNDDALNIAYTTVKENFSVDAFLESHGSDFHWGEDNLDSDDKIVDYEYLKSSLVHYLQQQIEDALNGSEYPTNDDVSGLADAVITDVIDRLAESDFAVEIKSDVPVDEAVEECACEEVDEEAGGDLTPADVLLPSRPDDDLTRELAVDHSDTDDMDRIVALARGKSAASGARFPQP